MLAIMSAWLFLENSIAIQIPSENNVAPKIINAEAILLSLRNGWIVPIIITKRAIFAPNQKNEEQEEYRKSP
jgi:hypothetical protein